MHQLRPNHVHLVSDEGIGSRTLPGHPVESVVNILEELLDGAKRGEVIGIAAAIIVERGVSKYGTRTAWRGGELPMMALAMTQLQKDFMAEIG